MPYLNSNQNIALTIHYIVERRCSPTWHIVRSEADSHIFLFPLSGKVDVFLAGDIGYKEIRKPSLLYIPKGIVREIRTDPEELLYCFAVKFDFVSYTQEKERWHFNQAQVLPFAPIISIVNFATISGLFEELHTEWIAKKPNFMLKCTVLLLDIIYRVMQHQQHRLFSDAVVRKVDRAIHFITEHCSEKLTLQQIANHVGLSHVYLGKIFKMVSSYTPIEYQRKVRLHRAKDLLLNDNYSVNEVAREVGYDDVYYFSRIFKEFFGTNASKI